MMRKLPFISSDRALFDQARGLLKESHLAGTHLIWLDSYDSALDHMNLEMPDLILLHYSDERIDTARLLQETLKDPWLLHGGIVAICKNIQAERQVEEVRGANILATVRQGVLTQHLLRVLRIIYDNRGILFHREIGADLVGNISGGFRLDNNPIDVHVYANLICNFLCNSNKVDHQGKYDLRVALNELLMNAIEHGNCSISYEEKTEWLDNGDCMASLIYEKTRDPRIAGRRVTFEYSLKTDKASFFIADQGDGFDWRALSDEMPDDRLLALHGRGILLARNTTKNLRYNEKGNEVCFEIAYQDGIDKTRPGIFRDLPALEINPGDVIFQEGDESTFLYYIAVGEYEVLVGGRAVSTLCANDIFMGEMSFLLGDRRTATVLAKTEGKLIRVSKADFVNAIKTKPHYGLLLSKLLAQRIERLNCSKESFADHSSPVPKELV